MTFALTESQEQITFIDYVLFTYRNRPDFRRPLFFSTQGGAWMAGDGRRKAALIAKYKREGWVSGVADILYLQPRGVWPFLAIEMKARKGGRVRPEQAEWMAAAEAAGGLVKVCRGADEAIGTFDGYMMQEVK